jgi:hypothetical protein
MILKSIIDRLNQRIEVSNIFDRIYGLCELTGDKGWIYYIGDGQAIPVTDYDSKQGTLFWAKRGKVNISKIDSLRVSGCKQMYSTKFNISAYAIVRKSHLPCDGEDAGDWVASRVYKLVSGRDYGFKDVIDVVSYEVIPNGYTVGDKTLPPNFEFATVVIELEVEIVSGSEDTCYDICNTGDIPLPPDFLPCTPCLTEVAVDGVTIIGNGTPSDPLIAVGGGGGGGTLLALPFTNDHLSSTGNQYLIGNVVWYNGNVYRCIANNDSILPTNTTYWVNLGAGFPLVEQPSNWNATSGNNQILNKPTIPAAQVNSDWNAVSGVAEILNKPTIPVLPATIVEDVTATAPLSSTGGATPDISIQPANLFDDGYLTSADFTSFSNKFDTPTGTSSDYLDGTGTPTPFPTLTNGTVTSVAATVPNPTNPAFSVNVPNNTTTPSVDITANGVVSQYVRGDGSLANFPLGGGGGASVSYYLNGSVNQGTFGGNTYYEMNRVPVLGGGTNFTRTNAQGNGYIAQFITDAGDPNLLAIPSGNWNFETYFNASSGGGNPSFYIELYKYDGSTFTLISSGATNPEAITGGTVVDLYVSALAVPSTVLLATDRLAIRIFVTTSGRTITLHTEDNNLCQVITTFTTGLNALNGLTAQVQNFATGTAGTDFGISSATSTHTFNLPTASATNRGALSSADWTAFNGKFDTPSGTTSQYVRGNGTLATFPTLPLIYKDLNNQTAVTGNTNNNKVVSVLIPANTIAVGNIIEIKARVGKTGTAGGTTLRIYVNTADSIVTPAPTLIITSATTLISQIYNGIDRTAIVKTATNTQTVQANGTIQSDAVIGTSTLTNSNIDWAQNQYIIFAIQNAAAGDSTILSYYQIEIK